MKEPSRQPGRFQLAFTARLNEVSDFYKQHGRYPDPAEGSIGNWVYLVRKHWELYGEDRLGERAIALEALPEWSWVGFRESNRAPFIQQLTDWYLSVDGLADPSNGIPEHAELAQWLHRNRKGYSLGKMAESRIAELEAIPFWSWKSRNHELDPKRSLVERELSWMLDNSVDSRARSAGITGFSGVRHQCDIVLEDHKVIIEHDGRLWHKDRDAEDSEKTVDLENAGWTVLRVREAPLEPVAGISVMVPEGASMKEIFDSTRAALTELGVPSKPIDPVALGKIPGGRVAYYDDWYSSFEALLLYIEDGGTSIPIATQETGEFKVGQWVYVQRRNRKRGRLSEQKAALLESITGWQWELKPQVRLGWEATYQRLLEYQNKNGRIPPAKFKYDDGLKLGSWVAYQRYDRRNGTLSDERVRKLELVPGWYW